MVNQNELTIDYIKSELENIDYGSVTITIHDGRITQIDTNEKKRYPFTEKSLTKSQ
jgi:hypothetical protein